MFAEAIPEFILQASAILFYGVSPGALIPLASSALTTGFISASLSYDWDTDMMWRKIAPNFYGYIPNDAGKRTGNVIAVEDEHRDIVALFSVHQLSSFLFLFAPLPILVMFLSLMLLSSTMLLVKTLTMVLLGLASTRIFIIYLGADLILYLLYKIMRNDFFYWLPIDGCLEIFASLALRVIAKVIVDFTSLGEFYEFDLELACGLAGVKSFFSLWYRSFDTFRLLSFL